MIQQAVISLNLLRASRINTKLSAYAQVFGQFSYNKTPIAPPGTHVLVHEKPHLRDSWAPHAVDAWYLGPALKHHRGYPVWIWKTCSERTTDTLTWLPKHVAVPQLTPSETIAQCTYQIVKALHDITHEHPSDDLAPNEDAAKALAHFHDILAILPIISEKPTAPLPRVEANDTPPLVPKICKMKQYTCKTFSFYDI